MMLTARIFTVLVCMTYSLAALADWQLDSGKSAMNFVSVKKDTAGEVHQFTQLSGSINKDGAVEFVVNLNGIDTGIDIRNERMKEHLFAVAKFPLAKATGSIDPKMIKKLKRGVPTLVELELTIDLHGVQLKKMARLSVVKLSRKQLFVVSAKPLLIDANDFALSSGIAKLKELAGLPSIAESVPVTVSLVFSKR